MKQFLCGVGTIALAMAMVIVPFYMQWAHYG